MINRFYLKELWITGRNIEPAKLQFSRGFNVIDGGSDAGKSYTYECLNYIFGGEQLPRAIPEANAYSEITLEIQTYDEKSFTFKRNLKSVSDIYYAECSIQDFNDYQKQILKRKHRAGDNTSFSRFLLALLGIADKQLKTNKQNKKRSLSIRDVIHLTYVDEVSILKTDSPIYSGIPSNKTSEKALFSFFLTGVDSSQLQTIEEEDIRKSRIKGQVDFIEQLIADSSAQIETIKTRGITIDTDIVDSKLRALTTVISNLSFEHEQLSIARETTWNQVEEQKSRLLMIEELVSRFNLLNDYYTSDLERLKFVDEGAELLGQLRTINCPICGKELDGNHDEHENYPKGDIISAISSEIKKITIKVEDLKNTIKNLEREKAEVKDKVADNQKKLASIESSIHENLAPKKAQTKTEIDALLTEQRQIFEFQALESRISELYAAKSNLLQTLESRVKPKDDVTLLDYATYKEFTSEVSKILRAWKFSSTTEVEFDVKEMDIVIDGKIRSMNGKGYRGVALTSFIIGLMNYCYTKKLPHPGTVVIDSPLTAYKKGDSGDKDMLTIDIEQAFFKNLSKTPKDRQIIVLENKEPEESVKKVINYIHFTKRKDKGRYGLFPLINKNEG